VASHIDTSNYDVAYGQNLALWQYVGRKRVPCVMNPHGLEPMKVRGLWARSRGTVRRHAFRYTARHSDVVVSLGGRLGDDLQKLLHVPARQVVYLPNGVDLTAIDRRRITGAPKVAHSFLCVGRLASNKGVDVLLQAFGILAGRSPARLYIVGDGPLRAKLTRASPTNVEFLGRQTEDELTTWYQRVEALILPSLYEGMPTVILEAMAFGLPIVATDIGAVATVVDRDNGLLVPPGSAEALAAAIQQFVALAPEVKRELAARSREKIQTQFTWQAVGEKTLALLSSLSPGESSNG
jgi:glycosyltransferase involved in cell wall biosynthesis